MTDDPAASQRFAGAELLPPWRPGAQPPGPSGLVSGAHETNVVAALRVVGHIPGVALVVDPPAFDPVVYVALTAGGDVLYVGRSHDLVARIGRHRHAFESLGARRPSVWASVRVPGPMAPAAEAGLIVTLRPQLNSARIIRRGLSGAARAALEALGIAHDG